jgi:hypothetical protein
MALARFGRARYAEILLASSVTPIGSLLIADLAGPSTEVIRLVQIRMIFPELLRRVGTSDAQAAPMLISDRQAELVCGQ